MTGMSHYEDYLSRGGSKRLGFGTKPDGEVHPVKALAIVCLVLGGVPFLASILCPVAVRCSDGFAVKEVAFDCPCGAESPWRPNR